jgi:hypothetical protein
VYVLCVSIFITQQCRALPELARSQPVLELAPCYTHEEGKAGCMADPVLEWMDKAPQL